MQRKGNFKKAPIKRQQQHKIDHARYIKEVIAYFKFGVELFLFKFPGNVRKNTKELSAS